MAKYRPIYTKIWNDPDFLDYDPEGKLIFLYICTNKSATESGVYALPLKTISNETCIPLATVEQRLNNGTIKNVFYDFDTKFIFVKNIRIYGTGGRPDLIKKAIEYEYRESRNTYLWDIFFKTYPEFNDLTTTVGEPLENPLPTFYNHNHNLTNNNSPSIIEGLSNNSSLSIYKEGEEINANKLRSLNTFKDWQDILHITKNKVGFLVNAFKHLHQEAPAEEFDNLGGRIAAILKKAGGDPGYVLKAIWDTSSVEIAGFHLDYIQQKVQKSRKDGDKKKVREYTTGKYGGMVQS